MHSLIKILALQALEHIISFLYFLPFGLQCDVMIVMFGGLEAAAAQQVL